MNYNYLSKEKHGNNHEIKKNLAHVFSCELIQVEELIKAILS